MSHSRFEVILQQDIPNLGNSGDLVKVRPGYARNFLIPQKMAVQATARNREQIEHQKRAAIARAAKVQASAEAIAKRLAELELTINAVAGEDQRLYGAVTTRDIAATLNNKGLEINHKMLSLGEPIKRLGTYEVTAKLGSSVTATFNVNVVAK
ncbi:MAG: 50S ribosomal protein L9 [Sorangium cellulosum]|nr:MAG: 50S ribosomal protein L9 [Sorangium cellulosum]